MYFCLKSFNVTCFATGGAGELNCWYSWTAASLNLQIVFVSRSVCSRVTQAERTDSVRLFHGITSLATDLKSNNLWRPDKLSSSWIQHIMEDAFFKGWFTQNCNYLTWCCFNAVCFSLCLGPQKNK